MAFERKHEPLLPKHKFIGRMLRSTLTAALLISGSLLIGIIGYHWLIGLGWIDAILNSSMILTGMGPVNLVETTTGKIFASVYAIFSGVMFITTIGVLLAPIIHRFLHHFHLESSRKESD